MTQPHRDYQATHQAIALRAFALLCLLVETTTTTPLQHFYISLSVSLSFQSMFYAVLQNRVLKKTREAKAHTLWEVPMSNRTKTAEQNA